MKVNMNSSINPAQFVRSIRKLASEAAKSNLLGAPAHKEALTRIRKPVDYMRCAEFSLALKQISLEPGAKVLDIGSPQWFSLYLASLFPKVKFHYVNILDSELSQIEDIAKCLGISNIDYFKQDVRSLEFDSNYFDKAISISVIEHIDPEIGGDTLALNEIRRVLVSQGKLTLSVPLKDTAKVVYVNGDVYERVADKNNFFAREYDLVQFQNLLCNTNYLIKEKIFIIEKPGLLALDFWEWGPGKSKIFSGLITKSVKAIERITGNSVEHRLAVRYLHPSLEVQHRVVNIVATLQSKD